MKKIRTIVRFGLLLALTVLFFNCKKDVVPTPSIWNYSTFTDVRDGKTYKSIKIGNQEWMAENMSYKTPTGSWDYGDHTLMDKYGRLYNWAAAQQAVPDGWHLPTDAEWKQLEIFLGMSQADADGISSRGTNEGGKLKSLSGWAKDGHGTDAVGFAALPGGLFMSNTDDSMAVDWYGYWWTATESDNSSVWFRLIVNGNSRITRNLSNKQDGFSVRCIKN